MEPSKEFRLLIRCCRASFEPDRQSIPVDAGIDWGRFLELVRFHRVAGLTISALASYPDVPERIAGEIGQDSRLAAAANLKAAMLCDGLYRRFTDAGYRVLFLKGITLAKIVFGDIAVKHSADIDILVDPANVEGAVEILEELGFALSPSEPSPGSLSRPNSLDKETELTDGANISVDLHSRLADNLLLIPQLSVDAPRQLVEVAPGISLPTLRDEELFTYLCVHGATSLWFRLKWAADLAGFLQGRSEDQLTSLYDHAAALGARRPAGQALLLVDMLFGSLANAQRLKSRLDSDAGSRFLARHAFRFLTRDPPKEPTATRLGTLPIHASQYILQPGMRFQAAEFSRQFRLTVGRCKRALRKWLEVGKALGEAGSRKATL